jgi:hypothetical protein
VISAESLVVPAGAALVALVPPLEESHAGTLAIAREGV